MIYAVALTTSGVPRSWAATWARPGVQLLTDLSQSSVELFADEIARSRGAQDIIVVSIHWGSNWGYAIPDEQRRLAHVLIDRAGVSIVYGHSSHHAKAIEVYRGRLILYGCGDFLNDYEGIKGHEEYRDDLALMYFAEISCSNGSIAALQMVPLQIRKFRLERPSGEDCAWLQQTLDAQCQRFGAHVTLVGEQRLAI